MKTITTAAQMQDALLELFQEGGMTAALDEELRDTQTFQDAGVLTRDAGVVISLTNGAQFQITIVKSHNAYIEPMDEEDEEDEEGGAEGREE